MIQSFSIEAPRTHKLVRLSLETDSWSTLMGDWGQQASQAGYDINEYAPGVLQELQKCCHENADDSGSYGLFDSSDGKYDIICQLNWTFLPGYRGKVLRLRHLTVSPNIDLQATDKKYEDILTNLLTETELLARHIDVNCEHIKFHLRSPGDRVFFRQLGTALSNGKLYQSVDIRGAWLYLSFLSDQA